MKKSLLILLLISSYFCFSQNPNLVSNGNMEVFNSPNSTPNGWSSASDFGTIKQNTVDFSEGSSSVELIASFSSLSMFTTVDIPLEAGKTYTIKYSYKYLGNNFDSNDNIEFSIFLPTTPFVHGTNIQDNNWNTVETQFTPTESKPDYEATIKTLPAAPSGPDGDEGQYSVLFDDIQVFEASALSTQDYNLKDNISIILGQDKIVTLEKSSDIKITNITMFSILGQQKSLNNNSRDFNTYNLSNYSAGIYILKIATNKGNISKKIVLQ